MDGHGIVKVPLSGAHLQRHGEALQHFIHTEADPVDPDDPFIRPRHTSFMRHG